MNRRAWQYIWCTFALGAILVFQAFLGFRQLHPDWLAAEILIGLAIGAQLFRFEAPNHVLFYATPIFFFAGVILLGPFLLFLLIALPHAAEWARERWTGSDHLKSWYLQPFNIGMFWISGRVAQVAYIQFHARVITGTAWEVIAVVGAAIVYVSINHTMLGMALVLARKVSWQESGVLETQSLISDFGLLCVGSVVAILWTVQPWFILPALAPLALMYQALMVPLLKQEAERDAKTGLYNSRYFGSLFATELDRARRFDRPLACIMADLDYLRDVNNTHGHLAGDAVLIGIGEVIRSTIRDYDISGRFGGEEFAIILPEVDEELAREMAERLRATVEARTFSLSNGASQIKVTMSLGIAVYPHDGHSTTELMQAADTAVYAAKTRGRNRVVCVSEVPEADSVARPRVAPPTFAAVADPSPFPGSAIAVSPDISSIRLQGSSWIQTAFVGGVVFAGVLSILIGLLLATPPDPGVVILLALLAVAAELFEVDLYGDGTVSVSVGIAFTAALSTGILGLACVSVTIALVHHVRQGRAAGQLHRAAFNAAVHILSGLVVVIPISLLHLPLKPGSIAILAPTVGISALAYYAVETVLIATAGALTRGDKVILTWKTHYRWLLVHYVVLCLMGLILSLTFTALGGIGVAIFALPLFMMHYAQKQYVAQSKDSLHALQRLNRELLRAAHYDHLTGLGNERGYQETLQAEVETSLSGRKPLILARLNIDEFKAINETFGRRHGDRVLIDLAAVLRTTTGINHAFRLAGDEFALILSATGLTDAVTVIETLRQQIPIQLGGVTVSFGIAVLPVSEPDHDLLGEQAIEALSSAKRRGRNIVVTFDEIRDTTVVASSFQAQAVRRLLSEGRIEIAFQPIWDIDQRRILGYEALSRPATDYGLSGPQEAFDIATRLGRAHDLDGLCRAAILARAHEIPVGSRLFMNLAPETLEYDSDCGQHLLDAVVRAGLVPAQVVLEITERSIVRPDTLVREAEHLRDRGFQLALDDTGAGNAGLGMLSQLKVDFVKIDRGVIYHASTDQAARAVLAGIIALAREMGAYVIAEGIETVEMFDLVREASHSIAGSGGARGRGVQGYLFGRPTGKLQDSRTLDELGRVAFATRPGLGGWCSLSEENLTIPLRRGA